MYPLWPSLNEPNPIAIAVCGAFKYYENFNHCFPSNVGLLSSTSTSKSDVFPPSSSAWSSCLASHPLSSTPAQMDATMSAPKSSLLTSPSASQSSLASRNICTSLVWYMTKGTLLRLAASHWTRNLLSKGDPSETNVTGLIFTASSKQRLITSISQTTLVILGQRLLHSSRAHVWYQVIVGLNPPGSGLLIKYYEGSLLGKSSEMPSCKCVLAGWMLFFREQAHAPLYCTSHPPTNYITLLYIYLLTR